MSNGLNYMIFFLKKNMVLVSRTVSEKTQSLEEELTAHRAALVAGEGILCHFQGDSNHYFNFFLII